MMPNPGISALRGDTANSMKKNRAGLLGSFAATKKMISDARITKIQKLCARKAASVIANHVFRHRRKSSMEHAVAQAGARAMAKTAVANTSMTINVLRWSGMT